jgi:hypothetical protein
MTRQTLKIRLCVPILFGGLGLAGLQEAGAQVSVPRPQTLSGESVTEAERVTATAMRVSGRGVLRSDSEIFEGVGRGYGGSVAFSAEFDERVSLGVVLGGSSTSDVLADARAKTLDLTLEMLWVLRTGGSRIEVGPLAGYMWLSRGIYTETVGGGVAGVGARVHRPVTKTIELVLGVSSSWSLFPSPPLVGVAAPDPDGRAGGRRVEISFGLARRGARLPGADS